VKASSQTTKRISFFGGSVVLLLSITLVIFSSASNKATSTNRGVIFTPSVTLKSEPNNNSTSLFVIHEGATCKIMEQLDNWLRVRLDNGNEGWLTENDLREI